MDHSAAMASATLDIQASRSPAEQILALRGLKNEIVGHPIKKELLVAQGLLDLITRLAGRKLGRQESKSYRHNEAPKPLEEDDMLRLQALQVVSSIALGGPSFLAPLHSASAIPAILSNLSPSNNPPQLVLTSLRALSNITESLTLASGVPSLNSSGLADTLFARQHLSSLLQILSQSSSCSSVQSQIHLTASLIAKLCKEERHQIVLASSGVLDALATKLAGFAAASGLVVPGAEIIAQTEGLLEAFPLAAPSHANFAVILEAIAVIIRDSKFRASQFLYSPSILAVFPITSTFRPSHYARAAWKAFIAAGLSGRQSQLNATEYLLPFVPQFQQNATLAQTSSYPPLGAFDPKDQVPQHGGHNGNSNKSTSGASQREAPDTLNDTAMTDAEEPESPLISFLILSARSRTGLDRLMSIAVLSVLFRVGLTSNSRESTMVTLIIPPLVGMLDDDTVLLFKSKDSSINEEIEAMDWAVKEHAPAILATLITDSRPLQKGAYDAGAIELLSKLLKVAYDPVVETTQLNPWSPENDKDSMDPDDSPSTRLGPHGQSAPLAHKIRVRESTLKAIAALVPFKEEYRKKVVDLGMIPYIVESMTATPTRPAPKIGDGADKPNNNAPRKVEKISEGYGINPVSVLIAAVGATRAMSRSISILRTTLIDNGVAMPVFELLKHSDVEVQIAATAAVCNLVTDISPMRDMISNAGVLKILCEHAHSANAKLRLNAVWALKHFVHSVNNQLKREVLEELGQGWLVKLICDDTEDDALSAVRARTERSTVAASPDEMDEDMEREDSEDHGDGSYTRSNFSSLSRSNSIAQAEARLAVLRDAELNPARKARKDDLAVQEQGLDFIRNLIGGSSQHETSDTTEMIDFLFQSLGQDRVFKILSSKLRPKAINPFSGRSSTLTGSTSNETRIIPPQSEIILSVTYILVHMSASVPRHRQIVISQTDLLRQLIPLFNHPTPEVRASLCWLVSNLTWKDDDNDVHSRSLRAIELKKLGFLEMLEGLEADLELNVRERAKAAQYELKRGL